MYQDNVEIMFYFSKMPYERDEVDSKHLELVKYFRDSLASRGVYWAEHENMNEFSQLMKRHLAKKVREFEKNQKIKRVVPRDNSGTKVQNLSTCELLYEHDENGNQINGNIERLIEAVTEGCAIRIRVHHPNGTIQVMSAPL